MLNTDDIRHFRKASDALDALRHAVATAYGYRWCVNNEPGTSPERAALDARRILRDLMTHEQRGEAINRVREFLLPAHSAPKDHPAQMRIPRLVHRCIINNT